MTDETADITEIEAEPETDGIIIIADSLENVQELTDLVSGESESQDDITDSCDGMESMADTVDQIDDTVNDIATNQSNQELNLSWQNNQIQELKEIVLATQAALTGIQTTFAEMMLSQNQLITDTISQLNQTAIVQNQPNQTADTPEPVVSTIPATPESESAILGSVGQEINEVTEAVQHPIVSQPPGQPKRNWI